MVDVVGDVIAAPEVGEERVCLVLLSLPQAGF